MNIIAYLTKVHVSQKNVGDKGFASWRLRSKRIRKYRKQVIQVKARGIFDKVPDDIMTPFIVKVVDSEATYSSFAMKKS